MTESRDVSIDEVRALVAERQRYEDWLTALEGRRAETPARVFERVHGDYTTRRDDVLGRLRAHVPGLTAAGRELASQLTALEDTLGTLEDERAEAMLRTAVGEYDDDRWERVRQQVETQIAALGEQRTSLQAEVEEVRALLANAGGEAEDESSLREHVSHDDAVPGAPDADVVDAVGAEASVEAEGMGEPIIEAVVEPVVEPMDEVLIAPRSEAVAPPDVDDVPSAAMAATADLSDSDPFGLMPAESLTARDLIEPTSEELAELDNALAVFSAAGPTERFVPPAPAAPDLPAVPSGRNGVDVFDDAELGDLRMAPPARATAAVTPQESSLTSSAAGAPAPNTPDAAPSPEASSGREAFDDLAFLRSVVDPTAPTGAARASAPAGDQQKTLRCTECSTMNFPTEWYCERCGGELAAF